MQVFSSFENTLYIELAISSLEQKGVKKESIFAVPLNNRIEERKIFDTLHRSDGYSLVDLAVAIATAFSVIGASVGFMLTWGPIIWGIIAAIFGFIIGLGIKLVRIRITKRRKQLLRGKHTEIILIVDCDEANVEMVEETLWDHLALGVAKVKHPKKSDRPLQEYL